MLVNKNEVIELEALLSKCKQVEFKVTHIFSDGIYIRELHIPKDSLIVGKRHRESTINMLIQGSMLIIDGDKESTISAPYTFIADKFSKKAGYALEDSIWVNIHKTISEDLDEIEKQFIISEEEYMKLKYNEKLCLG